MFRSFTPAHLQNRGQDLEVGLPWKLLGVHSSRMGMRTRDLVLDESLGLNCAWHADILMTLTAPVPPVQATA